MKNQGEYNMGEEIGLSFIFQEVKIRGEESFFPQVKVVEEGVGGYEVSDTYNFSSWEEMKKRFPTFKHFLAEVFANENWRDYDGHDRTIYAENVSGAEGLYYDDELTPENASLHFDDIYKYESEDEDEDENDTGEEMYSNFLSGLGPN